MKLRSIELRNIGLYKAQIIDFYSPAKSICMIWGNNGAGKTTLLNSIKIGLLGSKSFNISYDEYCEFVKEKIISSRTNEKNNKALIKICLETKEQNQLIDYIIERTFVIKNDILEESVDVYSGKEKLDFYNKEQFLNKIEFILPSSLLDIIIFDGENAISILDKDEMHKLVKNIIFAVFGMDVYSNLIKDLNLYLKNMTIGSSETSDDQLKLIELENQYKECNLDVNTRLLALEAYKKQKNAMLSSLNSLLRRISSKTGVEFDEIINIKSELSSLQSSKKHMDDEIKYINEEIIPIKILHKRIKDLLTELEAERPYMVLNELQSLKMFFENDPISIEELNKLEHKINLDRTIDIKYNLSEADLKRIKDIDSMLDAFPREKLDSYYSFKNNAFSLLKAKIDSIEKLSDDESKEMVHSIEGIYNQLNNIQANIDSLIEKIDIRQAELLAFKKEYESLKKHMTILKKESNSYVNIHLYKDAIEQFLESNIEDVCKKLSTAVFDELKRIKFRNNSIAKVYISPKNYEVHLYETGNKLIPPKLFSAGEKQILLGLILKESIALSKIDSFFLFDTPVGRLDMSNRKVFTEEVIFKVSEQTIVFATDSDYSKKDYSLIKTMLTSQFKLTRNSKDQIVVTKGSIYS